jgi:hypothetical protein
MGRLKEQAGFTLMEMVLACTLVITITLAILPVIWQAKVVLQQGHRQIELHKSLQIGMEKMTSDLLSCERLIFIDAAAGYQPELDSNRLSFVSGGKEVRYFVDDSGQLGRTLKGIKGRTTLPVNQHIKDLSIEYFDNRGQSIKVGAAPVEVVRVLLTLTAGIDGTADSSLTSSVTLRVTAR